MDIQIEKVNSSSETQNNAIISIIIKAIEGLTNIEESYNEINKAIDPIITFKCGKSGSHIWVSNWNNERLMLITNSKGN